MNDALKCTDCGDELPADSPAGLCAKCMMKLGFETGHGPADPSDEKAGVETTDMNGDENWAEQSGIDLSRLPTLFPELEILEPLGSGGMGIVVLAKQRNLDRKVALKILRNELAKDPTFSERFTREARALARLSHPSIIGVHDFGQREDLYYFIMEYVDGSNLRHVVREGQIQPSEALAIVPQICDALQYAHDEGVVHRDIKPENILIDQKGRVKIADFGLAKIVGTEKSDWTLTGTRQVMGTPHYMAPEQMERPHEVDHRADIYSLGVVFYEMLTGELPLGRFAPPSKKVEINVRLDEVVMRTLAKEPELRYQQVTEIKTQVEKIGDAGPSTTLDDVERRIASSFNKTKDRTLNRLASWATAAGELKWGKKVESAKENIAAGTKVAAAGLGAAGAYGYAAGESAASFSKKSATGLWSRRGQIWNYLRGMIAWIFGFAKSALKTILGWLATAWRSIRRLLFWMLAWTALCLACFGIFGHKWFQENAQWEYRVTDTTANRLLAGNMELQVEAFGRGATEIRGWNPPSREFKRDRMQIRSGGYRDWFNTKIDDGKTYYAIGRYPRSDSEWRVLEDKSPIVNWIPSTETISTKEAQAANLFQIIESFRRDLGVTDGTYHGSERVKGLRPVSSLVDPSVFRNDSYGRVHPQCSLQEWFAIAISSVIGGTLLAGYGLILYLPYRRWRKKTAKTKKENSSEKAITTAPLRTDELYDKAVAIVLKESLGSVSLLQRELGIGYGRAARLIDMMADGGIVGPYKGSQPRDVLLTPEEWAQD